MTKTDKLIFWGVLAVAMLILLFSNVIFAKTGKKTVVIEVNGAPYATYRLEQVSEPKVLHIQTAQGSQEIELTNEKVKIIKSTCKDGLCLGEIESPGGMLVCLPNRIIVRMETDGEVDSVAY